jgi:hypothetical protein
MDKFNLPSLPPGWRWRNLPPLAPRRDNVYVIEVAAESHIPGVQFVSETLEINLRRDTPEEIVALFQAVCDKIALRILEVQSKPVQEGVDTLYEIYRSFQYGNQ